jgi:methylmalonyl-CoA mutase, C-terminal domain
MPKVRVLIGKPGLDGHDRGAKVVASALRDAGMEVVYTGLRATPEAIVQTAIQESCDVIGLSVLSGAHEPIARRIKELLAQAGAHIPVLMGGVIPPDDRERLRALGVDAVFGQEARLDEIVAAVRKLAEKEQS